MNHDRFSPKDLFDLLRMSRSLFDDDWRPMTLKREGAVRV